MRLSMYESTFDVLPDPLNVLSQRIVQTLMDRREMLLEYFSFEISETGDVKTLPHLLREYTPNLDKLPMFLMRLGPQVCSDAILPFHRSSSLRSTGNLSKSVLTLSCASLHTSTRQPLCPWSQRPPLMKMNMRSRKLKLGVYKIYYSM